MSAEIWGLFKCHHLYIQEMLRLFKWHCINDVRLNAQYQIEAAPVTVCSVLLRRGLQFPSMKSNLQDTSRWRTLATLPRWYVPFAVQPLPEQRLLLCLPVLDPTSVTKLKSSPLYWPANIWGHEIGVLTALNNATELGSDSCWKRINFSTN